MVTQIELVEQYEELTHQESVHLKKLVIRAFPYHNKRGQDSLYTVIKALIEKKPSIAEEIRYSLAEKQYFNRPEPTFRKRIRTYRKVFFEKTGHFGMIMQNMMMEVQNAK